MKDCRVGTAQHSDHLRPPRLRQVRRPRRRDLDEKEVNKQTGQSELIVKQHRGELHPQIVIYADKTCEELIGTYPITSPARSSLLKKGSTPQQVQLLARLPRGAIKTKDITGGLPRVAELFEARKPKDSAEIAKIDGVVDFRGVQKNKRIVVVRDETTGMEEEHLIPHTKHLIVQRGDHVVKGQQLTDGVVIPHEILEICGVRELQKYLVNQVQEVYRLQGVDINDKHIEIIVRQMLKKVRVVDPGDTSLLFGEEIDKKEFELETEKVIVEGGKACSGNPSSPRYHQGLLEHRVLHLSSLLPGHNTRPHRSCLRRENRLPHGLQRKRHHGTHHPWRHRL